MILIQKSAFSPHPEELAKQASRRMKALLLHLGLHGSPGDAKHRPETALRASSL
jgi:hypothetical protein